jgi:hypothetical protein
MVHLQSPLIGAVLPMLVVENSNDSPTGLTFPLEAPSSTSSAGKDAFPAHFKPREWFMNFPMFLLVFLLIFSLALLCSLCWTHRGLVQSRAASKVHTRLHRLLKPRTPDDCPACRRAPTPWLGAGAVSTPVRPWREVKSRRGAPKRVNSDG